MLKNSVAKLKTSYPEMMIEEERIDRCMVTGNPAIVERVVFNLLDNAAKFSPKDGKVCVRLMTDNHNTVFCVKDEGAGISESEAAHIFEPFYREDQSRNRKITGAGLGLELVKEFADAYGGTIVFSNNTPCGSVFTLSISQKV